MPNKDENKEEIVVDPTPPTDPNATLPESSLTDNDSYEQITRDEQEKATRSSIAFKEREAKRNEIPEGELDEKPITRRDLEEILSSQAKGAQKDRITQIAKSIASSPAEADAIVATFNNRVFPANLSLEEQIAEAKAIVTHKVVLAKSTEIARALKARDSINNNPAGTHRDPPASDEPKMSGSDAQGIKSAGYVWDGMKQVYRKKLGNGKHLVLKNLKQSAWIE